MFYGCLFLSMILSFASVLPEEMDSFAMNIWSMMFLIIGIMGFRAGVFK